ncbi:hypothetical protein [Haloplanus halophilus]|uniref:hypothetical protein n=1 Tax=Haloplanus halophilus TaxID=2949993 RepID=UPI0020401C0F|nr:hypothetical protein [Haloplanus sp. GDY1]
MTDETTVDTGEAPITGAVVERVAAEAAPDAAAVVDALLALNAELLGRHSAFERTADYVTVDGKRAYRVDEDRWASLIEDLGFAASTAAAVRAAHTEQARLLFASAVEADDGFAPDEVGVVVGVDTAEQF